MLVLLAGPTVYWRCMAVTRQAVRMGRQDKKRGAGKVVSVLPAVAMTAAAQIIGLSITAGGVVWVRANSEADAHAKFELNVERLLTDVQRRFRQPVYGLRGAAGLYAANRTVSRSGFRDYVQSRNLPSEFPGVLGFGFIQRVMRPNLDEFVALERSDHAPDFDVKNIGHANDLYVIKLIEPLPENRPAWGLDVGAEPVRRAAVESALHTGEVTLSGKITLVQDGRKGAGFIFVLPVYRMGSDPQTPRQREAALTGFTYCPVVAADLLAGVMDAADRLVAFSLSDGSTSIKEDLLFDARPESEVDGGTWRFGSTRTISVGGRALVLRARSTPAFEASVDQSKPLVIAFCGAALSFLLALAVWLLAVGRVRAQKEAQRMTADLDRLAKVVRRTSNAVIITDKNLKITWVNEGFTKIAGYALDDAVGHTPGELLANPSADPATLRLLAACAATGESCRVEVLNKAKDGHEYWIDTEVQPTRDESGVVTGFMEIGTDVTEKRRTNARLQAALRETDALLKTIDLHSLVSVTDQSGRITKANAAFCELHLRTEEELLRNHHRVLKSDAHPESFWTEVWRTIVLGQPWRGEICNLDRNSSPVWIDTVIAPFVGSDGVVEKFISIGTDITARKSATAELARERERLSNILSGTNVGTWEWNITTGETLVNARSAQMVGRTLQAVTPLPAQNWEQWIHPDDRMLSMRKLHRHFQGRTDHFDAELRMRRKDGEWSWMLVRGRVSSLTEDGKPEWMSGTQMDISKRKLAEAALRDQLHFTQQLMDSVPIPVQFKDLDGRFLGLNGAAERMLKVRREDWIGKTLAQVYPSELAHTHDAIERELIQQSGGRTYEGMTRASDGTLIPVRISKTLFTRADGSVAGTIAAMIDIGDFKKAEQALHEGKEAADSASRAKSQFLANMSHEIRTPMNAILGMLQLLQKTELTVRQLDYAAKTEGAARSLLGLLNDILDFSKVEAGKMALDPRGFRLDALLRDLSVILSANIGQKNVEVLFDVGSDVPGDLQGDDLRLQQILINLAGNAIKFTAQGEVVISIRVRERRPDAVLLQFAVRDTGIGIAPKNQTHIFSGFSQAEGSTTRRFGGTGLGLAICQRLVGLMGGELELESGLGVGSTFRFGIWLQLGDSTGEGRSPTGGSPIAALRTLIVDDNPTARATLSAMARSLGWEVELAESGEAAIATIETSLQTGASFDAMFVDWHMPGLDGWETSSRIRALTGPNRTPVVVMVTAHGREMLASRSADEQKSLSGFLVKPVTASMLFEAVADAKGSDLRSRQTPDASRRHGAPVKRLLGMRLLVVEDNLNNQQIANELLSCEGAHVELASNGAEGVNAVATAATSFDAVLMDIQMPVMDGYTATAEIRQRLRLARLPIIAMTANAMASDREACLAAGMNDHVGKPFDLGNLVRVLQLHTGRGCGDAPEALLVDLPEPLCREARQLQIDLPGALSRMAGNSAVYARLLRGFVSDARSMPRQLAILLKSDQRVDARRLMHTLKGLAGTLGANELAAFASEAERALTGPAGSSQETLPAGLETLLQRNLDAMSRIADRLDPAADPNRASTDDALDEASLVSLLGELRALLSDADMRAVDVYAQVRKAPTAVPKRLAAALDLAIMQLDFEQAIVCCDAIKQGMVR
ncbi:MAG: CHASE domain-containing protein [Caldimonas sp.]